MVTATAVFTILFLVLAVLTVVVALTRAAASRRGDREFLRAGRGSRRHPDSSAGSWTDGGSSGWGGGDCGGGFSGGGGDSGGSC